MAVKQPPSGFFLLFAEGVWWGSLSAVAIGFSSIDGASVQGTHQSVSGADQVSETKNRINGSVKCVNFNFIVPHEL